MRCCINFTEFFVFILTVISRYYQGKETGLQPGGLSPRENLAIVTSRSKKRVPTRLTGSVEQIYHLQFFFTTNPKTEPVQNKIRFVL